MRTSLALLACSLCLLPARPSLAQDAPLAIAPTTIALSPQQSTETLTLTNEGTTPATYTVRAFAWSEHRTGPPVLARTTTLIVYPQRTTIAPSASQIIRIGTTGQFASVEKTYRLLLEQEETATTATTSALHIKNNFSIPVFVSPIEHHTAFSVSDASVTPSRATITITDIGNTHALERTVVLSEKNKTGRVIATQTIDPWYLLISAPRDLSAPIAGNICAQTRELELDATFATGPPFSASEPISPRC